jgi:hypothetical protein
MNQLGPQPPRKEAHRNAVLEFIVAGRHEAERVEPATVADKVAAGHPAFGLGWIDAEIRTP